jgi:hypothetical protein
MPRKRSQHGRKLIRSSFLRFIIAVIFFVSIFMLGMSTWNRELSEVVDQQQIVNVDLKKLIQGRIADVVALEKQGAEDFEDIEADIEVGILDSETRELNVKVNEEIRRNGVVEIGPNVIGLHRIQKPKLSRDILELHRRLNLSNPGKFLNFFLKKY